MKILTIEGLKATGKSLLCHKLTEKFPYIRHIPKFSKGNSSLPSFLTELTEKYACSLPQLSASLGLGFYANFFNNLANIRDDETVLLNRGLLSLPYFSYYGYYYNPQIISIQKYKKFLMQLYKNSIFQYKEFENHSVFLILESDEEEIRRRLDIRMKEKKIPSDVFFLTHFHEYQKLKTEYEKIAQDSLNSKFIYLKNNNRTDLEKILEIASFYIN